MQKLIIVGAGGHGKVVKEIAESTGLYGLIDFVDDNSDEAIGKTSDLEKLREQYDSAFVGLGDNNLRREYFEKLQRIGYNIPILVHPSAYISKSAKLSCGTVIEPKAVVNTGVSVGVCGIISVGAIVDHDACIEDFVHINAGAVCMAESRVPEGEKIDIGQIVTRK